MIMNIFLISRAIIVLFLLIIFFDKYDCWMLTDVNVKEIRGFSNEFIKDGQEIFARSSFSLIYPGTKWCGPGNIADNIDDLGPEKETDACCRDHDHCADIIVAGGTKYNLTNTAFYTRLNCNCDEKFRQCLHDANTLASNQIGIIYFDTIGTQCYRKDCLITGCKLRGGWLNQKCLEYSFETNSEMFFQWFDVPSY